MVIVIFIVVGILIAMFLHKREKAENTIREQRDFLNTLVETIPNPVFYKDSNGKFSGCNSAFEHFIGKQRVDIIGKTTYDLNEKEMADNAYKIDQELFHSPGACHYESRVKRGDGIYRDVLLDKASIVSKAGKVEGLIGVISDITERKQAEEEKMDLEKQLHQSQKMESIGTLAGGIAHDFNNILFGIIGFTELCLGETEPDTILHGNLKEILTGGIRAKALVKQILTFSRQSEQERGPIQIGPIIKEVSKLLRSTLPTTIEIKIEIQTEIGIISGDPTQIHQVIMNLCMNAQHAMEKEGGIIKITLSSVKKNNNSYSNKLANIAHDNFIKLSVSDTGTGIPREIQDLIFDPFFTSKEQGKGTGMGLSVVHGIVKSHGGHIEVNSFPQKGTTFDVYFPIIGKSEVTIEVPYTDQLPRGKEHVFLVDDEMQVITVQTQILEKLNYTVTSRTSSLEAIEAFKVNNMCYDVVITDMTMPKMTGVHLAAELKKIKPGIPVILCTGFSEKLIGMQANEIGVDAFLMKPVGRADLAKTIRQVLDK